jgi:hypothetical protein
VIDDAIDIYEAPLVCGATWASWGDRVSEQAPYDYCLPNRYFPYCGDI